MRVLVADPISEEIISTIGDYEALVVRSQTQVSDKVI